MLRDRAAQFIEGAARDRHLEVVRPLVDRGLDLNAKDRDIYYPLTWAIENDRSEVVKRLLEEGADPNVKRGYGLTPLKNAGGLREMVEILNAYGARE